MKYKGWIVLGVLAFIAIFMVAIPLVSYGNSEADLRTNVEASQKANQVVYEGNFNQELIEAVRTRTLPVWEGVIVKGGSGHDLWMRKVKSNDYLEKLKAVFRGEWEKYV